MELSQLWTQVTGLKKDLNFAFDKKKNYPAVKIKHKRLSKICVFFFTLDWIHVLPGIGNRKLCWILQLVWRRLRGILCPSRQMGTVWRFGGLVGKRRTYSTARPEEKRVEKSRFPGKIDNVNKWRKYLENAGIFLFFRLHWRGSRTIRHPHSYNGQIRGLKNYLQNSSLTSELRKKWYLNFFLHILEILFRHVIFDRKLLTIKLLK